MDHDRSTCGLCLRWDAFETGHRWTRHEEFIAELDGLESDIEDLTKELDRKRRRAEHLKGMMGNGPPARFRMPSYPLPPEVEEAKRHHDEASGADEEPQPTHR